MRDKAARTTGYTRSGRKVRDLSVATNRNYKDRDGNEQSATEWYRVVVFGNVTDPWSAAHDEKNTLGIACDFGRSAAAVRGSD